ncbi:MAG TPA: hypothetical protein PLD53_07060 [Candidatus Propionivibrio aalborgensis]|nr:hypothetical protein [Candidatus Propionivibrio aalborgensis]
MEQVTALELRKNLSEIARQVRDESQKKMLVVHGEPNIALVPVSWGRVADQADEISAQHDISMNKELADIFRRQAEIIDESSVPVSLSTMINTFVDHATIVSKYKELTKRRSSISQD